MVEGTLTRREDAPLAEQHTDDDSLVRLAIEQKVPVEILEKLVALQQSVQDRNARDAFFTALANFQEKCPPIKKNKSAEITSRREGAKSFSYKYATLDELQRHIRPYLRDEKLSYSFDVEQSNKTQLDVICVVRHVDGHSERNRFPVPVETGGRMSDAQANGAALTYGKRQALSAALGLSIEEDTDAKRVDTVEYINEEQVAAISDLIEAAGVKKYKFLEWLGVPSVAEIVVADFQKAVDELNARIRKNRAGEA